MPTLYTDSAQSTIDSTVYLILVLNEQKGVVTYGCKKLPCHRCCAVTNYNCKNGFKTRTDAIVHLEIEAGADQGGIIGTK